VWLERREIQSLFFFFTEGRRLSFLKIKSVLKGSINDDILLLTSCADLAWPDLVLIKHPMWKVVWEVTYVSRQVFSDLNSSVYVAPLPLSKKKQKNKQNN